MEGGYTDKKAHYYHKYIKYKTKYYNLKQTGGIKKRGSRGSLMQARLPPVKDYQTGIIEMFHKDLSQLNILQISIGDGRDSIALSRLFKSFVGQERDPLKLKQAKQLCKKFSCPIQFTNTNIDKIKGPKDGFQVVLVYNPPANFDLIKQLDNLIKLITKEGVVVIDLPKGDDNKIIHKFLLQKAPHKYQIKVKYFDKKDRDTYALTNEEASFNVIRGRIPIPPAERWY